MAIETHEHTVEVYDNATREHYTRPATAEELGFYEVLAEQLANPLAPPTPEP